MKNEKILKAICPLPIDNFPFVEGSFDSLTLYGYIQKMIKAYNNLLVVVKQHQEFIDNYESQIDEIERQIAEVYTILESYDERIDNKLEELENELELKFNQLTNQVLELIDSNYNILKAYIDERDAYLENKIDHISIDSIELRDPTTGLISNIQVVINNLFNTFSVDAITASEFDALELTATAFDAYQITAYDFDTKAKTILI